MFPPLAYLDWIKGRPAEADHDLGSSDLRTALPGDAVDPVPDRLAGLSGPTGDATLEAAVADEYGVDPASVLLTAGATHANFVAAATAHALAVERADETADGSTPRALVEKAGYEPLVETPRALGTRVERFRRPGPEAALDPDRAASALDTAGDVPLSHLTVTNRHNPTGYLADREDLAEMAEVARDRGGYLLVDEVYAPYTADARGERAFGGPTAAGLPATVVTGSLTKFHGLGELRVGWVVGPERFVDRAGDVVDHVPGPGRPSVALARRFFEHRDALVADAREHCAANHDLLAAFVADRSDLSGVVADGSPFAYVEHDRADGDAVSEAAWEAGVLVVPGRFFGAVDGVRVSLGREPGESEAALAAFGRVLDDL
ncbi:pyridoxal phosphate-dependent aminotransferase [Candidatus Halobonum tyrrellensis]|uniref:Class I and II aminotransferase n=1 Tax=Candidatus Halobonum tyrrellensis G22 TaxID=1324957 RepID=V4GYE7_9EURY|nr:pyridoxal phosphate-dependent aminotransferase [Candidatus Halobonum tyrrellensis]ESP90211.1 class I and II aminotransferase [Candidatus Halobonum tyrrellensis G22]